jgi:uncharacterized protein
MPSLFNVFGQSPIRPLQKHMITVHECVSELQPFFIAAMKKDWAIAEKIQSHIAKLEGDADDIKRDLRLHLPRGLFMAVPRSDALELISKQDLLANRAKDISGVVLGRRMEFPEPIQEDYMKFLQRCIDASYQAHKVIRELDKLLEVGFRGREVKIVEEMVDILHQIEKDTDRMQIQIRRTIFSIEGKLPPVGVVFLYKVIEWTGDLANRAQHVGDRLQMLVAR